MLYKTQKAFVQRKNIFVKTLYKLVQHTVEKNKILYNMSLLETLKHYFDISNTSIAHLIGASSSLVHSVSSGRRSLSLYHIQPLVLLQEALEVDTPCEALPYAGRFVAHEQQKLPVALAQSIKKMENKLLRRQDALAQLKAYRQRLLRGLNACDSLLEKKELTDHQAKWVRLRKRHLTGKLKESPLAWEVMLQTQVKGLEAQLTRLREAMPT
ncbi:hypothetical protein FNH22_31120 [Fulvivirga sp. M361]|uniref:hypothetical protein n=1 Tax=Fulvivirga sp. M361 TaxID=2594266 RepID=UPI00117A6F17|nr:hypothetical protein [Fulvivirga sp. M361]TRX46330.1 hypothetical protein FNH22_31120 [Fulvivirga sp. M361]